MTATTRTGTALIVDRTGITIEDRVPLDAEGFIGDDWLRGKLQGFPSGIRLAALRRGDIAGWVDDTGHVRGRPVEFILSERLYRAPGGWPIAGPMIITRRLAAPDGRTVPLRGEHITWFHFTMPRLVLEPTQQHPQLGRPVVP